MKTSPTQRSLKLLRDEGYYAEVVEHFNVFCKRRFDLLGFIDVLAIHPETGDVRAVQTTSASNVSSRVNKIMAHENLPLVRKAGWTLHIHGWRVKAGKWVCRVEDIS